LDLLVHVASVYTLHQDVHVHANPLLRLQRLGHRVQGLSVAFKEKGLRSRVGDLGFRIEGSGSRRV
jgi:hypothetical protein